MMAQLLIILLLTMPLPRSAALQSPQQSPAEEAFNRAVELQRQGRWEEAVAAWRAFLKLEPKHAGAHANLGTALSRLNQYEEAIASFETALKLNPGLTPLLYNLGIAHFRAGQFTKAADQSYLRENDDKRAIESFTAAARLDPELPRLQFSLGVARLRQGQHGEAAQAFEKELAKLPRDFWTLYYLAYLREAEGRLDRGTRWHLVPP